jgi:hypothetical protein
MVSATSSSRELNQPGSQEFKESAPESGPLFLMDWKLFDAALAGLDIIKNKLSPREVDFVDETYNSVLENADRGSEAIKQTVQNTRIPERNRGKIVRKALSIIILLGLLLAACGSTVSAEDPGSLTETAVSTQAVEADQATATADFEMPTSEIIENTPQATTTPEGEERVIIDMSEATLDRELDPNCVDQFPENLRSDPENNQPVACFTFDNWVRGPLDLGEGYEMVIGAEGWFEQDGQQTPVLIPLAVANRERNEIKIVGAYVREFAEYFYEGDDEFWQNFLTFGPGGTIYVTLAVPEESLVDMKGNEGFGFEAAQFSEEDLEALLNTGDSSKMGSLIWPTIRIVGIMPPSD